MSEKRCFENLSFEKFKEMALSDELSSNEKIGFPDDYRQGKEKAILSDMLTKVTALNENGKIILDIGPGCSLLPILLSEQCAKFGSKLILVDSDEMLSHLPDASHIEKYPGRYPETEDLFKNYDQQIDGIIVYSVIQYIFTEGNLWDFLDKTLSLLSEGGTLLLGDIPNSSMRKRFFSSNAGIECHLQYTGGNDLPDVKFNRLEKGVIDDAVVMSIIARARLQGFHAWIVPQAENLPMANRREDILIRRP